MFDKNILEATRTKPKSAVVARMKNKGIFLANNYTYGQRTRHVDIRTHHVC